MSAYVDRSILNSQPSATQAQMRAYLTSRNTTIGAAEVADIVVAYWRWGVVYGIDPAGAFAQACHETNLFRFGGQVAASQHNPAGLGATNDGAAGLGWQSWEDGVGAHYLHLLAWCNDQRGRTDRRWSQVMAAAQGIGFATTWRSLGGRWAVPGVGYGDGLERHWQAITQTPPEAPTMLTKPPVTSKPSPNRNGYGGTRRVDAIVWHVTVGGLEGSLSWLTNPASAASSNYVIGRDGAIYELVPPTEDAWANGAVKAPDTSNPVIAGWLTENVNLNQRTVSVEHERLTSANEQPDGFTEAQHRSTVQLAAWLCQTFSIPPDRQHIIRHGQIDSVNRAHCPGLAESEMVAWIGEIAALVSGPQSEQPQTKPTAPGMDSSAQTTGWYLNDKGQCVVWANLGGTASSIVGVNFADLGCTVQNAAGETFSRSIVGNEWQPWHKDS